MPEPLKQDKELLRLLQNASREHAEPDPKYFRSPIRYPGNKFNSLKEIITVLPKATKFIDACGGSGVVTMNLSNYYPLKVFNDRHAGVVAFFRCVQDHAKCEKLIERLDLTIHAREDFIWCRDTWANCTEDVERAARWYYCVEHSFAGLGRNFGRQIEKKTRCSDERLHNKLPFFKQIKARFAQVQVENLDVIDCIKQYASHDAVCYIDPDYIDTHESVYRHQVNHQALLDLIHNQKLPGYYLLSGYKNTLYDNFSWDQVKSWKVSSWMLPKVFNEENNLEGKEHVMAGNLINEEVLWIKDNR